MRKQDFGPDDLAASLTKIGHYLEGIASATGLLVDSPEKYEIKLNQIRSEADYSLAYTLVEPLITIRVSSYKGFRDLSTRCLPSILQQTYSNWEVIIVGDCDPQADLVRKHLSELNDSRFKFIQREFRGPYPEDPRQAWLITGAHAFNVASREAQGLWLAKLDQDDSWEPNHLEVLLDSARKHKSEIVYGKVRCHFVDVATRPTEIVGDYPPKQGSFALTAALSHGKFKVFEMNEQSYLWNDPGDWGLVWRLWLGGARFKFIEEVVANVYILNKVNKGYFESQYQILLETISKMQGKGSLSRTTIANKGKLRAFLVKIMKYVKRRIS
jgi:glycosyltransferase involved in cell wall biosynthesis